MLRLMRDEDIPELRELWKKVFGDGDEYLDLFFRNLYRPGGGVVMRENGELAAMGFLIDIGVYNGSECLVTYAVACDPRYRGRGFGGEISRRLYDMSGEGGVICPAEASLFGYYAARTDYKTEFFVSEKRYVKGELPDPGGELRPVDHEEYARLRETRLQGTPHIVFNTTALRHQHEICGLTGGGMYELPGMGCAAVERWGETLAVKELLVSESDVEKAAAVIIDRLGGEGIILRTPAKTVENARPFAMGKRGTTDGGPAWYGFAFD